MVELLCCYGKKELKEKKMYKPLEAYPPIFEVVLLKIKEEFSF